MGRGFAFAIVERHHLARRIRQLVEDRLEQPAFLVGEHLGSGVRTGVERQRHQLFGVLRGHATGAPPFGTQHVVRAVPGHLPQPGEQTVRVAEAPEVAPGREEDLLRDVAGELGVAHDGERDRADDRACAVDEVAERIAVAARGGRDVGGESESERVHGHCRWGAWERAIEPAVSGSVRRQTRRGTASSAAKRNAGSSSMMKWRAEVAMMTRALGAAATWSS